MSLTKIIIIFGIVLLLFVGVFFYLNSGNFQQIFGSLPRTELTINKQTFRVEIAKKQKDAEIGLSGRKSLAENAGMLFAFDKPGYHSFWMKGMNFPLDIIFINNNKIVAIYRDVPPMKENETGSIYGSDVESDKVLEINAGLAKKYFFNVGDTVENKL